MPGAPHRRPQQRGGPAGTANLPREECAQRRGNLLGMPVAANKPEAHRPQERAPCPRQDSRQIQGRGSGSVLAKDAEHRSLHRNNCVPAWIRPRRIPRRLTTQGRTHRRINAAGHQDPARQKTERSSGLSVNCRHSRCHCPPESKTTTPRTDQRSRADRTPARRIGRAPWQGPRAAPAGIPKFKRARHTCRARRADEIGRRENQSKPRPKPGFMLTQQRALLRRPQAPHLLHRCRPARPAPPPRRWKIPGS